MIASNYNLWSVAGFVYALAGAAIVVNTMFLAPAPTHLTVPESGFRDPQTLRRMSAQWLDARVGAALLVIGFFLQATGAVGTATLNTPAVFVLLGLALFAGYYGLSRDLIIDGLLVSAVEPQQERLSNAESESPPVSPSKEEVPPVTVELRQSETAA
jgi:hypothetical protein